jgi:hypothetical protein
MVDGPLEYLIKAGPECYMYLRCDELLDYQKEDESLDFPGSAIVIERLPHSGTILNLQVSGKPVETGSLEAKELHTLDLGPCVVFPQDREFPQMLRDGLGA